MVASSTENGLIYGIKLCSVGLGNVTDPDMVYQPGNMDFAMKLHYVRVVYYFGRHAFEGLTIPMIKEPMFEWLNQFPMACGRFRRTESGRAYIKCNDAGARFVEAKCDKTIDEWLELKDGNMEKLLVPDKHIGPDLQFSPPLYFQFTQFKCGGMAVGLSWPHVLGDPFSAAEFMNMLGRVISGSKPRRPVNLTRTLPDSKHTNGLSKVVEDPLSIKRVDPVGDRWVHSNAKCEMEAFTFTITPTQLNHLQSKVNRNGTTFTPFEVISAVIWQSVARIRGKGVEPRVVTAIYRRDEDEGKKDPMLRNSQVVSVVEVDFPVAESDPSALAALMKNEAVDERKKVEEVVAMEGDSSDFIIYGANLTFVNLERAKFFDFVYKKQNPVSVSCRIDGVGDNGAVLVLPGLKDGSRGDGGRTVTAILPVNEVIELKSGLTRGGLLAGK